MENLSKVLRKMTVVMLAFIMLFTAMPLVTASVEAAEKSLPTDNFWVTIKYSGKETQSFVYNVTLSNPGTLTLQLQNITSEGWMEVALYDYDRVNEYGSSSRYNLSASDPTTLTHSRKLEAGTYTVVVKVSRNSSDSGSVRIRAKVDAATGLNDGKTNHSFDAALKMDAGKRINGYISQNGAIDFFKFYNPQEQKIVFRFMPYARLTLELYNEDKEKLWEKSHYTDAGSETSPGNTTKEMLLGKGWYYIKVSGSSGNYPSDQGKYQLWWNKDDFTGFKNENGTMKYYKNGSFYKQTGLVKDPSDGTWNYIVNGIFTNATGLVQRPDTATWHYVVNGVYSKKTGLVQCVQPGSSKGKWYYVENGDLAKKTGLVQCIQPGSSKGKWYYVVNGKTTKATGVVQCIQPGSSKGKWYYVKEGKLTKSSGVAQVIQPGSNKGKWFYVRDGKHIKSTGTTKRLDNGKKVKVVNGVMVN